MQGFGVLVHLTILVEGFPALVVFLRRSRNPAHLWIAAGSALTFIADTYAVMLGHVPVNNQWVGYAVAPAILGMFLIALARWQLSYIERTTVRVVALLLVLTLYLLTLTVENLSGFSRFTGPLGGLVLLAAAIWTVLRRSFGPAREAHIRTDWFWVSLGLALYAVAAGVYEPVAAALMGERVDLVYHVLTVRLFIYILGFLCIAWGLLPQQSRLPTPVPNGQ